MTATDVLIQMLDAFDGRPDATALRARSYDLLLPPGGPGGPVADVGCGAGRAVAELSERGVRAIGVDLSEQMIEVAARRRPDLDVRVGDACALPFKDGELVGYRADKVLHTLPDPAQGIAEAYRVLAPGGRAVVLGQDWEATVIDSDRPELTRRIIQARAEKVRHPRAARAQRRLLLDAGFREVTVEAHTAVFTGELAMLLVSDTVEACRKAEAVTDAEADEWLGEQRLRAGNDRLFVAVPFFMAAGTRP